MKAVFAGFVFGLTLTLIGLFIGLQVSSSFGSILLFPLSLASSMLDQPFGQLPNALRFALLGVNSACWALIYWVIYRLVIVQYKK